MATASVETRQLAMHKNLLVNVIKRQAGTLHKAILEGVMNGVDAGATEIHVDVTKSTLIIRDNGRGMTTRKHILQFWEVFGEPPAEGDSKTYGQFRMGRGQLFAFGKNTWRTGKFLMTVDIDHKGLEYDLSEEAETVKGCEVRVELYEELLPSDKAQLERELGVSVKYVPAAIHFNGELISTDPKTVKWDQETDEAYIKLKESGSLHVFNLGVLVCSHSGYVFGCGGEVVSKQQLKVNFARNEVMSDCKVWKKIKPLIDQKASDKSGKSKALTDDQRQRLCDQLKAGDLTPDKARTAKLLTDCNGRHWAIEALHSYHWRGAITLARAGDARGAAVMAHKLAFVVSAATLERFGVKTLEQLIKAYRNVVPHAFSGFDVKDFKEMTAAADSNCELLPAEQWNVLEKTVMYVLNSAIHRMSRSLDNNRRHATKVVVGMAENVESWTDGETFIAVSRKAIEQYGCSIKSWIQYGYVLLHNLLADGPNHDVQEYSPEFYQQVQTAAEEAMPEFLDNCLLMMPRAVEYVGRKETQSQLRDADRIQKHQDAESKLQGMLKPSTN